MPNICNFDMLVKGEPEDLRKFLDYFIYSYEAGLKKPPYLARTFVESNKADFFEEHSEEIEQGQVGVFGWCAWSCYSCWIKGYPQDGKGCVTLSEVCKKHKLEVEVDSSEDGMCFTERIVGRPNGDVEDSCEDYPEYTCRKCGNIQSINPEYFTSDENCYDCGAIGEWEQ
jgi:hypothetical protein